MFAATHFDKAMGIDTHITNVPSPTGPPIPVPLPYLFMGIVIDYLDYIPGLKAKVWINGLPRAQAGTPVKGYFYPHTHIPKGVSFTNPSPPKNEGEILMGSSTVIVENEPLAYSGVPVLSCNDFGTPPPPRPNIEHKTKDETPSWMLPTSILLPIPKKSLVLIGGFPTVSVMTMGVKVAPFVLKKIIAKILAKRQLASFAKDFPDVEEQEFVRKVLKVVETDIAKKMSMSDMIEKVKKKIPEILAKRQLASLTKHFPDVEGNEAIRKVLKEVETEIAAESAKKMSHTIEKAKKIEVILEEIPRIPEKKLTDELHNMNQDKANKGHQRIDLY